MTDKQPTNQTSLVVARATFLGIVGTIPLVGPTLSELVGASIPDVRFERVERLADELKAEVVQVADRLDTDYVRRDEFATGPGRGQARLGS